MNEEQLQNFDFISVPVDSPTGYILEVDLEYDESLHLMHNDYPLCPENVSIVEEDLSPYTRLLAEKLEVNIVRTKKLVCKSEKQDKVRHTLSEFATIRQIEHMSVENTPHHRIHPESLAQTVYRF